MDVAKKARQGKRGKGKFAKSVKEFAERTQRRAEFVYQQSVSDVITTMQTPVENGGNMPVDTGFLRASLRVTLGSPATGMLSHPGGKTKHNFDATSYELIVAGLSITDKVYATYLADYAVHQEYGSNGRTGRRFVALAALQWPAIVQKNATLAQAIR